MQILTKTTSVRSKTTAGRLRPPKRSLIPSPATARSPELATPLPRAIPPMARKTMVHKNCSKSSCSKIECVHYPHTAEGSLTFRKTPVEKKATIGMSEIIPMSPKVSSRRFATHQRTIVAMQTNDTQYCFAENFSLVGRISLMNSTSPSAVRDGR